MSFTGQDVLNSFFSRIDEAQATSHHQIGTATTWIKEAIIEINQDEILSDYTVISGTAGTRNYALPGSFFREQAIFYKGRLLQRVGPKSFNFYSNAQGLPVNYTIIPFPQDTVNTKLTAGVANLLVDPSPDTTSPVTVPAFPTASDPFFSMFYFVRIPTNFTASTIAATTFNMPDDMFQLIANRAAMTAYVVDGNPEMAAILEKRNEKIVKGLSAFREWSANQMYPQVLDTWGDGVGYPFSGGYLGG